MIMQKYAICFIFYSVGRATENSNIYWLTGKLLGWTMDLEEAKIFDDRSKAEAFMNQSATKDKVLNLVTINWYEEFVEEQDEKS